MQPDDPFAQLKKKRRPWWIAVVAVVVVAAVAVGVWKTRSRKEPLRYLTARATVGDVVETVEATGTVQPLLQVQVGSQVSGRLARVLVNYNSRVTAGQVVAELDPTPFRATVAQARAAVAAAESQLRRARANAGVAGQNLARAEALRARDLNAQADLDTIRGQHSVANADVAVASAEVARARASLAIAETNLTYTRIHAPIDGVVIQRSVEEGQTVAASLQAPVLFVIANDLTRMQIIADIDEADVGKLRERLVAEARVDAFPSDTFRGEVTEVRYGPTSNAGVVTYPAVVRVANPDLKLRPGMTATLTVTTARREDVLRVPNAALRFRPGNAGMSPRGRNGGGTRGAGGGGARGGGEGATSGAGRTGRVFVLRNGQPTPVRVRLGVSDGTHTEVTGDGLRDGTELVIDEVDPSASGGAPGGGMPGTSGSNRPGGMGRRQQRLF